MKAFTVRATRSGKWWAVTVDEEPRAQTQARTLDQVESVASAVLVDLFVCGREEEAVFTLVVHADELQPLRAAALNARALASVAVDQAGVVAAKFATEASDAGMPLRDIGMLLGVSHQRAHQLLERKTA